MSFDQTTHKEFEGVLHYAKVDKKNCHLIGRQITILVIISPDKKSALTWYAHEKERWSDKNNKIRWKEIKQLTSMHKLKSDTLLQ